MTHDFSSLACVVSGSVSAVSRQRYREAITPLSDFSFLETNGATLFTKDSRPQTPNLIQRLMGERFQSAHAVAEQAGRFRAVLCIADDIGIPVQIAMALRRCRTPVLIGVHGHFLRNPKFKIWARTIRGRRDVHLLAISEAIRSDLLRDHKIPPAHCTTLCPPVDTRFFTPRPLTPQTPPLVLSAGAAGRDYDTLLAVAPQIEAHFRIASGSNWAKSITAATVPMNCVMGPAASMQELRDLYAASSIVVLPLHDTFHASGIAVAIEAMAMAKPLIVTRTQAPGDFFIDNETCLMVPPADGPALKSAILRLLADLPLQERLGKAALDVMQSRYSLAAYAEALNEIIPRVQAGMTKSR